MSVPQHAAGPGCWRQARDRPLRVLYSFPHTLGRPGIATTALQQLRGLVAEGIEVSLWCTSMAGEVHGATRVVETLRLVGRRIPHRALGVHRAYRWHDRHVARALERSGGAFDLVHCWPAGCLQTLRMARRLGLPALREAPSPHTQSAYERAAREAASLGLELPKGHSHRPDPRHLAREQEEYQQAEVLLVPSAYAEATFRARGFPPERLARHQYGFDPAAFPSPAESLRPAGRPFTALFAGRCEPNKGLHYALRAWFDSGAAQGGRFVICGSFLPGYRAKLAPLLAHPSVEVTGFVADVGALMREADVLVLPTVTEGSALVTYEAQASGCVPLVSDAAGAVCRHLQDGLVHPAGDVPLLTEHLASLARDRALLARLRARSLARRPELTWSAAGARLATVYEQVHARASTATRYAPLAHR